MLLANSDLIGEKPVDLLLLRILPELSLLEC